MPEGAAAATVKHWWLARSLYRVRSFHLALVPPAERRAALRNLVLAWAPFDTTATRVALRGERGLACAWDLTQVGDLLRAAGADAGAASHCLPEGLVRAPASSDGLRLLKGLDGMEAQLWSGGWPVESRWWPQSPATDDWEAFVRSVPRAGASPAVLPALEDVAWLSRPWIEAPLLAELRTGWSQLERLAVGGLTLVLLSLTAAQASEAWTLHRLGQTRQAEIDRLQRAAKPVLAARDSAQRALGRAEPLSKSLAAVQPVEVLRHLAEVLPAKGVLLREFDLSGTGLRLGLELAPEVQRSTIVRDLQAGGWIVGVTEQREAGSRSGVVFEMKLSGINPPVAARKQP